jgi:hypothetical protein
MRKTAAKVISTLGLLAIPALNAAPVSSVCASAVPCKAPEPSAVPELCLSLAAIGIGYWLWRRSRKPV